MDAEWPRFFRGRLTTARSGQAGRAHIFKLLYFKYIFFRLDARETTATRKKHVRRGALRVGFALEGEKCRTRNKY